jgi:hypothetical protein
MLAFTLNAHAGERRISLEHLSLCRYFLVLRLAQLVVGRIGQVNRCHRPADQRPAATNSADPYRSRTVDMPAPDLGRNMAPSGQNSEDRNLRRMSIAALYGSRMSRADSHSSRSKFQVLEHAQQSPASGPIGRPLSSIPATRRS